MASNKLSSERAAALARVRESEDAAVALAVAAEGVAERAVERRTVAVQAASAAELERDRAYAHVGWVTGRADAVDAVFGLVEGTVGRCQRRWSREDAAPVVVEPVRAVVVKAPRARPVVAPVPVEDVAAAG